MVVIFSSLGHVNKGVDKHIANTGCVLAYSVDASFHCVGVLLIFSPCTQLATFQTAHHFTACRPTLPFCLLLFNSHFCTLNLFYSDLFLWAVKKKDSGNTSNKLYEPLLFSRSSSLIILFPQSLTRHLHQAISYFLSTLLYSSAIFFFLLHVLCSYCFFFSSIHHKSIKSLQVFSLNLGCHHMIDRLWFESLLFYQCEWFIFQVSSNILSPHSPKHWNHIIL